jgi:hypothetical protein
VTLVGLVWNGRQRRLRAPFRLLGAIVFVAVATAATGVAVALLSIPLLVTATGTSGVVLTGVGTLVGVVLTALLLDRRPFADYGFHLNRRWGVDLAGGLALGGLLMALVFAVELAAGWLRVVEPIGLPDERLPAFVGTLLVFCLVGVYEELLLRGVLLRNVAEGAAGYVGERRAVGVAVLLSSAVFGALHLANPNATLVSALGISFAGVMLAAGYVLTGELAFPIGLHVTWNAFQGLVFGFPVSGLAMPGSLVTIRQHGPALATGGSFGPEAGLVGLLATVVGTAATALYVRRMDGSTRLSARITTPELRWRSGSERERAGSERGVTEKRAGRDGKAGASDREAGESERD